MLDSSIVLSRVISPSEGELSLYKQFILSPKNRKLIIMPKKILSSKDVHIEVCRAADLLKKLETNILLLDTDDLSYYLIFLLAADHIRKSIIPSSTLTEHFIRKNLDECGLNYSICKITQGKSSVKTIINFNRKPDVLRDYPLILFTSGTQGRPKGVPIHRSSLVSQIQETDNIFDIQANRYVKNDLSLHWISGYFPFGLPSLVLGVSQILSSFSVQSFVDIEDGFHPNFFALLPSQYAILRRSKRWSSYRFNKTTTVISGGSPVPKSLPNDLFSKGIGLFSHGYSLTEAVFPVFATLKEPGSNNILSLGQLRSDYKGRLESDGELIISGQGLMRGYLPDLLEEKYTDVLHTGDLFEFENDSYYFKGRKDRMFKYQDQKIFPESIESIINEYKPEIECLIHPQMINGDVRICLDFSGDVNSQELRSFCIDRLPNVLIPKKIRRVNSLKRNRNGKLCRGTPFK